jgi:PAS domain S-box-containing protein
MPTEAKQPNGSEASDRLRRAEERLRLAIEAARLGIWYSDYPFDRVVFSPEICKYFNLPIGTVVPVDRYFALVHPDDRAMVRAAVKRSIAEGVDYDVEYRVLGPERIGWVRSTGCCFRDPGGNPLYFDGITYDITQRKEEEEQLRRTEERLRLAVAAARLGVWYIDLPFHTVVCSPGIKEYLGIPTDTEVTVEMYYSAIHPDDREQVRQALNRALEQGTSFDAEYRNIGLTERARLGWVRATGRCFLDRNGKPHHLDGVIQDITREKRATQERERLLHELSEANLLRERLLGIVGHDLKSPLAAIDMTAKLLQHDLGDEAAARDLGVVASKVERIQRCVERMKRLIGQLLDFARIRAYGGLPMELGPADLRQLCRELISEQRAAHPEAVILLEDEGDCRGLWDGDRLGQLLSNVLGNAIVHGSRGPIAVRVRGDEDDVEVAVHNQGAPIPADLLPFIFDPFRQGARPGKGQPQSIGLGLYIAQQIVLAHGGRIEVKSPDGDGTTVAVRLPRRPGVRQAPGLERRDDGARLH